MSRCWPPLQAVCLASGTMMGAKIRGPQVAKPIHSAGPKPLASLLFYSHFPLRHLLGAREVDFKSSPPQPGPIPNSFLDLAPAFLQKLARLSISVTPFTPSAPEASSFKAATTASGHAISLNKAPSHADFARSDDQALPVRLTAGPRTVSTEITGQGMAGCEIQHGPKRLSF